MPTFDFRGTDVAIIDEDDLTVAEILVVEGLLGKGLDDASKVAVTAAMVAASIARAIPGTLIPDVFGTLTVGEMQAAMEASAAAETAAVKAALAELAASEPGAGSIDEAVLSPTSAAS